MRKLIYPLLLLAISQFNCIAGGVPLNVKNLKCEYRENPLGIDVIKPMLLWQIESAEKGWMQSAYEIKVASSESLINEDKGSYTLNVDIPANTLATVFLPATDIKRISENGKPLLNNKDFGSIKTENGKTIVDIGSGSYSFTIKQQ